MAAFQYNSKDLSGSNDHSTRSINPSVPSFLNGEQLGYSQHTSLARKIHVYYSELCVVYL